MSSFNRNNQIIAPLLGVQTTFSIVIFHLITVQQELYPFNFRTTALSTQKQRSLQQSSALKTAPKSGQDV